MRANRNGEAENEEGLRARHPIAHYPLPDLLPPDQMLALHPPLGLLSHLAPQTPADPWPHLLHQEQFSASELRVLLPLLSQYPHFCPSEALWASFYVGRVTDETLAHARTLLHEALSAGVWDHEMRPIRNTLSRTRLKLRGFGLEVRSILETGYLLKPLGAHKAVLPVE